MFNANTTNQFQSPLNHLHTVLVIGNGPSAKLLDYTSLWIRNICTVGMNSAFRYWIKVDFRPTFYICMDDVVIKNIADDIANLVKEGRIKKFFLRDAIKDIHPELTDYSNIIWFSEKISTTEIFSDCPVSTGSWAIRWMIDQGKSTIATIGIDGINTEILSESERDSSSGQLGLVITKTPTFNPNYFFSDYQVEGDKYQVPNNPGYEKANGRAFHEDALLSIYHHINKTCIEADIIDLSPLSSHGIFRKLSLLEFRSKSSLVAVLDRNTYLGTHEDFLTHCKEAISLPHIEKVALIGDKETIEDLPKDEDSIFSFYKNISELISDINPQTSIVFMRDRSQSTKLFLDTYVSKKIIGENIGLFIFDEKLSTSTKRIDSIFQRDCIGVVVSPNEISPHIKEVATENYFNGVLCGLMRLNGLKICATTSNQELFGTREIKYSWMDWHLNKDENIIHQLTSSFRRIDLLGPQVFPNLSKVNMFTQNTVWLGRPEAKDFWPAISEVMSFVKLTSGCETSYCIPVTVRLSKEQIQAGLVNQELVIKAIESGNIIEWELSGAAPNDDIISLLDQSYLYQNLVDVVRNYPLQSYVNCDHASPEQRQVHIDYLLAIKYFFDHGFFKEKKSNRNKKVTLKGIYNSGTQTPNNKPVLLERSGLDNALSITFDFGILRVNEARIYLEFISSQNSSLEIRLCRDGPGKFEETKKTVNIFRGLNKFEISHEFLAVHLGCRLDIARKSGTPIEIQIIDIAIDANIKNTIRTSLKWNSDITDYSEYSKKLSPISEKLKLEALEYRVIVLDPDAKNTRGHYLAYDEKLKSAINTIGIPVEIFCRNDIEQSAINGDKTFIKCFDRHSWTIATNQDYFFKEVQEGLKKSIRDKPSIIYMYTGSIYHASALARLAAQNSELRIHCNLFWEMIKDIQSPEYISEVKQFFLLEPAILERIYITAPTNGVAKYIKDVAGVDIPIAPHPCTGVSDSEINFNYKINNPYSQPEKPKIVFPGAATQNKGYDMGIETATTLSHEGFSCWVRPEQGKDIPTGLNLIPNELTDEEFKLFLSSADVIVLPYERSGFKNRTSGIVIDAFYLGVPVVVLRETWLAEFVNSYNTGIAAEPNSKSLSQAVKHLTHNENYCTARVKSNVARYHRKNSWSSLAWQIIQNSKIDMHNIKMANFLFRNSFYREALFIYNRLYKIKKLDMYRYNIELCIHKMQKN